MSVFPSNSIINIQEARKNGQVLTSHDETRLRNHQLRMARRMYLKKMELSPREPLCKNNPLEIGVRRRLNAFFIDLNWIQKYEWYQRWIPVKTAVGFALRFPVVFLFWGSCYGDYNYFIEFGGYQAKELPNGRYNQHINIPGTYPDDKFITGRYADIETFRGNMLGKLKDGAKPLPDDSFFDWIECKNVRPGNDNYCWINGAAKRKKIVHKNLEQLP